MGPLFNRVVSETLEEETSNPVTMSAVKMEEVGVFSESVNRELEWNDSHLGCQCHEMDVILQQEAVKGCY